MKGDRELEELLALQEARMKPPNLIELIVENMIEFKLVEQDTIADLLHHLRRRQ